ncbi:MAG: TonB-dependent receptor, partial [Chitinophagaceae bacterium]|nr:TonB-dependent receptor [Chitinophagaceae bacterium]
RGKEVKALLIDGDDMTQDQYQLLSRNLNADVVDKLQVIDNYNKNRIMGDLVESNQAAINLKLKKSMQGKVNGSASAAGSVEGRYEGDATLVWLKSKFKMIGLFNSNNISKDATGLLRYQEFGSQGAMQQREELTKKIVNGPGIITTGLVAAPDISREYVLDNRNYFTSPLLHFRLTKSVKLAMRTYAVKDRLRFTGSDFTNTIVSEQNQWSLSNNQFAQKVRHNISTAIELSHDNLKKFAGNLNLQIGWVKDEHGFQNFTSGFFTDTLSESLKAQRKGYAAAYNGASKVNDHTVFNIQSNFSYLPEIKNFEIQTNRLHFFYSIKDSFDLFRQQTNIDLIQWQNSFSFFRKKSVNTIRYGVETNWQAINSRNSVSGLDSTLSMNSRKISFLDNRVTFSVLKQISGKSSIRADANTGLGLTSENSTAQNSFFLWKASVSYRYKIKAFSGFNFSAGTNRELPNVLFFHPSAMVSANASIKDGASIIKPVESFNISASFADFKIMSKFSLLAGVNVRYAKTDYVVNNILVPQYSVSTWSIVNNNRQVGANFDIGTFIFPLNSTFRFSSNANYSINNALLNNNPVENQFIFAGITATWVPNFKWPIGWELNFSKDFFSNKQTSKDFVNRNSNQTTNILFKLRSKFKGNYYVGTQYNYLQLSSSQQFHLWSVFQNLILSQKLNMDVTVHNLLNKRLYTQQYNSPNSISKNTFVGIGRYILCRVNWSF